MKNRNSIQKLIIGILTMLLLVVLYIPISIFASSARIWEIGTDIDPGDTSGFNKSGSFRMDSSEILKLIDQGQNSLFLSDTMTISNPDESGIPRWTQADYQKVAAAFFEFVWKESLSDNWSIHKIFFNSSCNSPAGFERASFVYYQLIYQQKELKYEARAIDISLIDGKVSWGGDTIISRPIMGAHIIDLNKIYISADEVLGIAEENGGKAARQNVNNNCELYLLFNKNWEVVYASEANGLSLLEIVINPYTGKIISSR